MRRLVAARPLGAVALISAQAGLAAAAAWIVATDLLGREAPVFAPIAALATIASASGQRARQTAELLVGVGLGITVADALLYVIGTGAWQIAFIVASSVAFGLLVAGRSGALVSQAGATAILFVTLAGNQRHLELPRILDTAVGAGIGLLTVALLRPLNPLRDVDRAVGALFAALSDAAHTTARALSAGERELAVRALHRLNAIDTSTGQLEAALTGAGEVVKIVPWWRHLQERHQHYQAAAGELDAFIVDLRVLARRAATLLEYREPVPEPLPEAVAALGDCLRHLRLDWATGRGRQDSRDAVLEAARRVGRIDARRVGILGDSVVVQIRSAASDLLRTLGIPPEQANQLVREAVATAGASRPPGNARIHDNQPETR